MTLRAFLLLLLLAVARDADAQWFFVGYAGANATRPATVSIDIPATNVALEFRDVEFEAKPFESPQYYGWRLGKLFGGRTLGLEFELIHMKMYAKTTVAYPISGASGAIVITPGQRMDTIVERFAMSHGLNYLLVNLVGRRELRDRRVALIGRGGAGITVPHTETTVLHGAVNQYEYAGPGAQAAIGLDVQMRGRLSFVTEYKFTYSRPKITVSGGEGRTIAATHHIAFGLAFGLSR